MRSLIGRELCGGPQIGIRKKKNPKAAKPRFWPISGPFWVRVGVRDRVRGRGRVRGWVGSTAVSRSGQEVLSARKREQRTATATDSSPVFLSRTYPIVELSHGRVCTFGGQRF